MEIVRPFIQPLMSCIGTPLMELMFGYLKAKENVGELSRGLEDLEAKKHDIQNQIDAARRHGQQPNLEVTRWIEKVEGLGGEVTKVQSDYNQIEGRCWPNYCWSSYKIGKRASKLLIEMIDLKNERAGFGDLATDAPPAPVEPMYSTSNVVGKMINLNKEKICRYLEGEAYGVIGIRGMGGVGKTTLLKAINDNFLYNNIGSSATNKLFDHVIFIVVSKEHQIENLQKIIIEKLGLKLKEGLVSQARIIYEYLKEKNFLLLLDDIWKEVQLKDLGIPYYPSCSGISGRRFRRKVVFTTRSEEVCKAMKDEVCECLNCDGIIIKVECLEADEAWKLFKGKVGKDIIKLPGIRSRAEEVTKECGGLPLVLVVIGRAMATKKSPQEWDYALTQLRKSQPSNISGIEDYFPQLKLSYDSLRDDKMRECFLCCSLWPEDFKIRKEELIMCWMGLGLIDDFEDINEAYGKGYDLIGRLTNVSLLEPVHEKNDVIKVHDVIRDLALWIARDSGTSINKWLVEAGVGLEEVHSEVAKWGEAERISLMRNRIKELPPHLPLCPNLSTLILRANMKFVEIPADFFTRMRKLTYLDLSGTGLQDIPKEICCLDELTYLNLSTTQISTLPKELGQLKHLKYLLLRYTYLKGEVRGIIGRLRELEYLDLYPYGYVDTDELLSLPLSLKVVGMRITLEHALEQLYRVVPPILYLNIKDMGGDSSSTTSIHLHHLLSTRTKQSLRELELVGCSSIRELVVDVDVRLPSLESLSLLDLKNLTEIVWRSVVPPSECFPWLRFLTIDRCHGLKDITWVLHLPCLEDLSVWQCDEMEQLVVIGGGGEEVTKPTFPSLRHLFLLFLPKLVKICDNHAAAAAVNFPSLERLDVRMCNGMKDITWVLRLPCLEELHVYECNEMEQLVVIDEREKVTKPSFPRLTKLYLYGLPKLAMICDNQATAAAAAAANFPSLELLHVVQCKGLKKLPFHPQQLPLNNNNCSRLKMIRGEREWWDGIEWEDQSAQSSLQPYFHPFND